MPQLPMHLSVLPTLLLYHDLFLDFVLLNGNLLLPGLLEDILDGLSLSVIIYPHPSPFSKVLHPLGPRPGLVLGLYL